MFIPLLPATSFAAAIRDWVRRVYQFAPRPDRAFYFNVPIEVSVARILSGRAKIKDYEAGMDLKLAAGSRRELQDFPRPHPFRNTTRSSANTA